MRLLGLDLETTGLDTAKDRITELGVALWDVETKRPLYVADQFFHEEGFPTLSSEIVKLTGITDQILAEFGLPPRIILEQLEEIVTRHKPDYIVAHNGEGFDRPLLLAELDRHGVVGSTLRGLPWIDSRSDIPHPTEPDSRRLRHLALDCGFINPFEHRALFDVLTMLRVLSHYPIDEVLAYRALPSAIARAIVPAPWTDGGVGNSWVKSRRYGWERCGDGIFPKQWVRKIKLNLLEEEQAAAKAAGFEVVRLK